MFRTTMRKASLASKSLAAVTMEPTRGITSHRRVWSGNTLIWAYENGSAFVGNCSDEIENGVEMKRMPWHSTRGEGAAMNSEETVGGEGKGRKEADSTEDVGRES